MADKTFLIKGLTAGTIGQNATEGSLDITEKVLAVRPELRTPTFTSLLFSTIVAEVKEGKAKLLLNRKSHIKRHNTSNAIHDDANAIGGITKGPVSTAKFKNSKKDSFEFTLNKSWDAGFVYDKKKDPKVNEGKMIDDLASLLADITEEQAADYWEAINSDVVATDKAKSILHGKYVSSRDGKTKASPELVSKITYKAAATLADRKETAAKIISSIWKHIEKVAKMGRKGAKHDGYPYSRGTRDAIGLKVVIDGNLKELLSNDERFIQTGLSEKIVQTGAIGMINNTPVFSDDVMDSNSHFQVSIISTGAYSPVILAKELNDEFALFPHPTKRTRADLLEGSGGWDTYVTPYINLCRFLVIEETP